MNKEHTKAAAGELDRISGDIHLCYMAFQYLANKLLDVSEERLEPTEPGLNQIQLLACYRESYNIALILADYAAKLSEHEKSIDKLVSALYLDKTE